MIAVLGVLLVAYSLWGVFVTFPGTFQFRAIHLSGVLIISALVPFAREPEEGRRWRWDDAVLLVLTVSACAFVFLELDRITSRVPFLDPLYSTDYIFFFITLGVLLELTRRQFGLSFPILVLAVLLYTLFMDLFPGPLRGTPVDLTRVTDTLFLRTDGIFGSLVAISATYMVTFLLFAAVVERCGLGNLFRGLAEVVGKRTVGGSAKAAVTTSALFGMFSGSAVANVYTTGSFTIPYMKRSGYRPEAAAGAEAVASSLGNIIPPMLGTQAFMMIEFTGRTFGEIAMANVVPSLFAIGALYLSLDLYSRKNGFGKEISRHDPRPPDEPSPWSVAGKLLRDYGHTGIGIIVLIFLLANRYSAPYAAGLSTAVTLALAFLRRTTRPSIVELFDMVVVAAKRVTSIALILASAGVLVGTLNLTGINLRISALVAALAGDSVFVALVLIALLSVVVGLGAPQTATYVLTALVGVPVLVDLGVPPLAGHMFAAFFSVLSGLTPPVALYVYAAASIADAPLGPATKLSMIWGAPMYIIPFVFVFAPSLLIVDGATGVVGAICLMVVALTMFAVGTEGFWFGSLGWPLRVVCCSGAVLAFVSVGWSNTASYALVSACAAALAAIAVYKHGGLRTTFGRLSQGSRAQTRG